jgi:hypothetical protein
VVIYLTFKSMEIPCSTFSFSCLFKVTVARVFLLGRFCPIIPNRYPKNLNAFFYCRLTCFFTIVLLAFFTIVLLAFFTIVLLAFFTIVLLAFFYYRLTCFFYYRLTCLFYYRLTCFFYYRLTCSFLLSSYLAPTAPPSPRHLTQGQWLLQAVRDQ